MSDYPVACVFAGTVGPKKDCHAHSHGEPIGREYGKQVVPLVLETGGLDNLTGKEMGADV